MTLNIELTANQERGATSARLAYNANPPSELDAPFETNEQYLAWVISKAADSYASQYPA